MTATNAVGAHAGSLSSRIGATADCDRAVTLEFTMPDGAHFTYDSDAAGHWMGVVGDAYLCQRTTPTISVLARAADASTWLASVPIETEAGGPPDTGFGPDCDVLLRPALNFITWGGPLVEITTGLSDQTFGTPLPRSDNGSMNPLDHITSVSSFNPETGTFLTWIPGAPSFTTSLDVLVPGVIYVIASDADIPLTYPAAQ